MRDIDKIILHCAATPTGKPFTVTDIDSWHVAKHFKRQDAKHLEFNPELIAIGYHFVIYIDGSIHTGRHVDEIGSHCSGLNSNSIGICLIGEGTYTNEQWDALDDLVNRLKITYPKVRVIGHYETPTGVAQGKTCPNFDVPAWVANGYKRSVVV